MWPLKLLKEGWLTEEPSTNLLDQVLTVCTRLTAAGELAQKNLKSAQLKLWYDKKIKLHNFKVGDKVLVLLPLQNHALQARYCGPYLDLEKVNDFDYVMSTEHPRLAKIPSSVSCEYVEAI